MNILEVLNQFSQASLTAKQQNKEQKLLIDAANILCDKCGIEELEEEQFNALVTELGNLFHLIDQAGEFSMNDLPGILEEWDDTELDEDEAE